jgi:hypothetical protein
MEQATHLIFYLFHFYPKFLIGNFQKVISVNAVRLLTSNRCEKSYLAKSVTLYAATGVWVCGYEELFYQFLFRVSRKKNKG